MDLRRVDGDQTGREVFFKTDKQSLDLNPERKEVKLRKKIRNGTRNAIFETVGNVLLFFLDFFVPLILQILGSLFIVVLIVAAAKKFRERRTQEKEI